MQPKSAIIALIDADGLKREGEKVMKKTMKLVLLWCLVLTASALMFTACDNTSFLPSFLLPSFETLTTSEETSKHIWTEWVTIKEATCEENGLLQRYCTECYYTESKPIDALRHTEIVDKAVPPTCIKTGLTEGKHCDRCNNIFIKQEIVPAIGGGIHNYVGVLITAPTAKENGITKYTCSICGSFYTEADCLPNSLTLTIDNRAMVCYSSIPTEALVIPACFENLEIWYRVTRIDSYAFYSCSQFTSVTIPDTVTAIGNNAFSYCSNLTSITFEGTVEQWNSITFGSGWRNKVPATEVICSNGVVKLN